MIDLAGELLAAPFFRKEEEGFLLVGVVVVGNVDRAANRVSPVVLFVGGLGCGGILTFVPATSVEDFVAAVVEGAAVEVVGAGFGFDFDGAGTVFAVLRAVVGREDLEFGDGF